MVRLKKSVVKQIKDPMLWILVFLFFFVTLGAATMHKKEEKTIYSYTIYISSPYVYQDEEIKQANISFIQALTDELGKEKQTYQNLDLTILNGTNFQENQGELKKITDPIIEISFMPNQSENVEIYTQLPSHKQHENSQKLANNLTFQFQQANIPASTNYYGLPKDSDTYHSYTLEDKTIEEPEFLTLDTLSQLNQAAVTINLFHHESLEQYQKFGTPEMLQSVTKAILNGIETTATKK